MSFVEQLNESLKDAMRAKDQVRLKVIRELKNRIKNWEIDQRKNADEVDFIRLVQTAAKQRKEAIDLYKKGDRQDLVDNEQAELDLLETYLPQMMSEVEIISLVDEIVAETGAKTLSDIGKVMPVVMQKSAGRADGKLVQKIVRDKLQNG